MTERERWIVYPLLFLALGAALRDKIFNLTQSQKVVCESLAVFKDGDPHRPVALLGAERLVSGPASDMINVDRIHTKFLSADQIIYRGQPLVLGGGAVPALTQAQFFRLLQSLGLLRDKPPQPVSPPPVPRASEEQLKQPK